MCEKKSQSDPVQRVLYMAGTRTKYLPAYSNSIMEYGCREDLAIHNGILPAKLTHSHVCTTFFFITSRPISRNSILHHLHQTQTKSFLLRC